MLRKKSSESTGENGATRREPREDVDGKEHQTEGPGVNRQNELEEAACDGLPTPCLAK
jgi:hypothetical protein